MSLQDIDNAHYYRMSELLYATQIKLFDRGESAKHLKEQQPHGFKKEVWFKNAKALLNTEVVERQTITEQICDY